MRVAMVAAEALPVPPIKGGAVEMLIDRLSQRLVPAMEVFVLSSGGPAGGSPGGSPTPRYLPIPFRTWERRLTARGHLWPTPYYAFPYLARVIRAMQALRGEFDVIHVHNRSQFVPWLRRWFPHARIVLHLYNEYLTSTSTRPISRVFAERIVRDSDCVVCCSDYVRRPIVAETPAAAAKSVVALNPSDPGSFRPVWRNPTDRARKRTQMGLTGPTVLFVGRLTAEKGAHAVLDAMKLVVQRHPSAQLMVVGSSFFGDARATPYVRRLWQAAEELGPSVMFTGQVAVDVLAEYYAVSDVFAFPIEWDDPAPIVVVEAMASGLPIVTKARGGVPEELGSSGAGVLLDRGAGAEVVAAEICRLIEQPGLRLAMGRRGRERVRAEINWTMFVERVTAVYRGEAP